MLRPSLIALALLLPGIAAAAEMCPWLNAATASGVLGGTVNTTVKQSSKNTDDAACAFSRKSDKFQYSLRIDVQTMRDAKTDFVSFKSQCGTDSEPLKAIGNEAVACSANRGEQVVGRVRDRAFVIRISTDDSSLTQDDLRERTRSIAEQVAGNLF